MGRLTDWLRDHPRTLRYVGVVSIILAIIVFQDDVRNVVREGPRPAEAGVGTRCAQGVEEACQRLCARLSGVSDLDCEELPRALRQSGDGGPNGRNGFQAEGKPSKGVDVRGGNGPSGQPSPGESPGGGGTGGSDTPGSPPGSPPGNPPAPGPSPNPPAPGPAPPSPSPNPPGGGNSQGPIGGVGEAVGGLLGGAGQTIEDTTRPLDQQVCQLTPQLCR